MGSDAAGCTDFGAIRQGQLGNILGFAALICPENKALRRNRRFKRNQRPFPLRHHRRRLRNQQPLSAVFPRSRLRLVQSFPPSLASIAAAFLKRVPLSRNMQ